MPDVPRPNIDQRVVQDFGREWSRFNQQELPPEEHRRLAQGYFAVFPWRLLPPHARGFDLGCGSGRWARHVAPRVASLLCVDASIDAARVAKDALAALPQCHVVAASVDAIPVPDASLDFGYSLGVLHHVPDTAAAIASCARKLRPGAPLLLYLYYAFDQRPRWFRLLWKVSDLGRRGISRLPAPLKALTCGLIALTVYWPLARGSKALERLGRDVRAFPLSAYRNLSFYTMRTDALDRFGTRLEQRFTRPQIRTMMEAAGLSDIAFHDGEPYWCAVGIKR